MQEQTIPYGYCQCGCGGQTKVYDRTRYGGVKGERKRFVRGHNRRVLPTSFEERFWARVDKNGPSPDFNPALGGCWLWTGNMGRWGYGVFDGSRAGRGRAHRLAYQMVVGPIPEGLELDHLCRVRHCVNPAHLEPVTGAENMRRANLLVTHCKHGHEFDSANTYWTRDGRRKCRACQRVLVRRNYSKTRSVTG